jgi:hypothetical protein|tara:strand:- start:1766 stop:1963 length:198 start_codon:yes stop_codon:yes gene_type:complete
MMNEFTTGNAHVGTNGTMTEADRPLERNGKASFLDALFEKVRKLLATPKCAGWFPGKGAIVCADD